MSQQDSSVHFVAIDMGSNSFHLVIAREQDGSIQVLHKEKRQVQLAKGLNADGILDEAAITRGINCLTEFSQRFSQLEQTRVRIVATHTLRVAKNAQQFLHAAHKVIGYPIEIVSGHEEARLIYSGIVNSQTLTERNLVIDIGGGSTEVVIGKRTKATNLASLKCGCVSYNQRYFADGVLDKAAFKAAQAAADKQFSLLPNAYFKGSWPLVLGSSGSAKAVNEALNGDSDTPQPITMSGLKKLRQYLIELGHVDHIDLPNLDPKRIPLLAAGLAILISFFKRLAIEEMQVAQGALREGVLYELSDIDPAKGLKQRTVMSLAQLYHADPQQADSVQLSAEQLFVQVAKDWQLTDCRWLLQAAAQLHEIGIHINSRSHHKHGGYIIDNSDLPGFSQQQQTALAMLVANHRKRVNLNQLQQLDSDEQLRLTRLLVIFRLAVVLNLGRIQTATKAITLKVVDNKLILALPSGFDDPNQLLHKDLSSEQKKLEKIGIILQF